MKEREAGTPWFTQKTNKALNTGLASLTKALGALSRQVKTQRGQQSEPDGSLCSKESAKEREREGKKERKKGTGTQALMEQRCFISRNAGLYIFSKMITQLLHRVKFYQ